MSPRLALAALSGPLLALPPAVAAADSVFRGLTFTPNTHGQSTRIDVMPDGLILRVDGSAAVGSVTAELDGSAPIELVEVGEERSTSVDLGFALTGAVDAVIELRRFDSSIHISSGSLQMWDRSTFDSTDSSITIQGAEVVTTSSGTTMVLLSLLGDELDDLSAAELVLSIPVGEPICLVESRQGCLEWGGPAVRERRFDLHRGLGGTVTQMAASIQYAADRESATFRAYRPQGGQLDQWTTTLVRPWDDGEGGRMALDIEGPSTQQVSILPAAAPGRGPRLALVSDGWTRSSDVPAAAEIDLGAAGTSTVPVWGFQATGWAASLPEGAQVRLPLAVDSAWTDTEVGPGDGAVCDGSGRCVLVADGPTGPEVLVTAFAASASALPEAETMWLEWVWPDGEIEPFPVDVSWSSTVAAVVVAELGVAGEVRDQPLELRIDLRGAPRGRSPRGPVVAPGSFTTAVIGSVDGGAFGLQPVDGSGHVGGGPPGLGIVGGAQIDPSLGESDVFPVPVILYGNGSGTKNASSQTSAKPQLL